MGNIVKTLSKFDNLEELFEITGEFDIVARTISPTFFYGFLHH